MEVVAPRVLPATTSPAAGGAGFPVGDGDGEVAGGAAATVTGLATGSREGASKPGRGWGFDLAKPIWDGAKKTFHKLFRANFFLRNTEIWQEWQSAAISIFEVAFHQENCFGWQILDLTSLEHSFINFSSTLPVPLAYV